jgi:dTDP-4-dehydrorhamnose reductase
MKVAVLGANGQLGADVSREFTRKGDDVQELSHSEIEICSLESVRDVLRDAKPQIIANTAAMHRVESCEGEPLKAYEVNALGARNLALVARQIGAVLIHISTDYADGPNEFTAKVPRPKYSVLENNALKVLGLNFFQTWEDGLLSYLSSQQHTN